MKYIFYILTFFIIITNTVYAQTYKQVMSPNICYLLIQQNILSKEDEKIIEKMFSHYTKGVYKIYYSSDTQTLLMVSDEIKTRYKTDTTVLCLKSSLSDIEKEKYLSEILNKQYNYKTWITKTENILNHIYAIINNMHDETKIIGNKKIRINTQLIKQDIDQIASQIKTMYNIEININPKFLPDQQNTKTLIEWLQELSEMYQDIYLIKDVINELKQIK